MTYTLTLKEKHPVTHDTYRLVFDRPEGFDFKPGQCTHWALDEDGWRDEDRAFTMTSQPEEQDRLEFVIKTYPDHDNGVTKQIPGMSPGDQVLADEPAGAITDHGPGYFIAGGAGITPYIPILRRRAKDGTLDGCVLIFSNETERDIILREEWEQMDGLKAVFVLTDEKVADLHHGMIEAELLADHVTDTSKPCYICGPQEMVDDIRDALKDIGFADDKIITENGW